MDPEAITELLTQQGAAFADFRKNHDAAVKALTGRLDEMERRANRPSIFGSGNDDPELLSAWGKFVRSGSLELRSMAVGSDPDGGYVVPNEVATSWTTRIHDSSPVRQHARIVTTERNAYEEPSDPTEAQSSWVGEASSRPETSPPQLGSLIIPAHEMYAMPKATQTLLEDASVDIGAWLEGKVAASFARKEATAFVVGDGHLKPKGFTTYPTSSAADSARAWGTMQYVPTGHASSFASSNPGDALISLMFALRSEYMAGAVWMMNRLTAAAVAKFRDAEDRPFYLQPLQGAQTPMLLGHPVVLAEDMPNVGSGNFPIAFGNFAAGYTIVDRRLSLTVLRDPYTDKPYVKFYCRRRVGGAVHNADAIKLLKVAET